MRWLAKTGSGQTSNVPGQLKLTGSAGDSTFVCGSQAVAKALATAAASRARSTKNNHLAVFAHHFDALRALACDPYQVRNATVCAIYYKPIILPRQAGDKHRKSQKQSGVLHRKRTALPTVLSSSTYSEKH